MLELEKGFYDLLMNSFTKIEVHVNHWQQSYQQATYAKMLK